MSIKITAFKGKVKQRGLYDFKDVYEFLYDYLLDEDFEVHEERYLEKKRGEEKEVEILWEATKSISDYFQIKVTAFWIILNMKKVEAVKDGQKVQTDSGVLEINVTGQLIKDPEDKWTNQPWKFLREIYDKFIIRRRIDQYEEMTKEETEEFIAYIKSILSIDKTRELRKETVFFT